MHKKLLGAALILILGACVKKTESLNAPLSGERMAAIMADIHLAEAQIIDVNNKHTKDSLAMVYYQQVLAIHNTNAVEVEESMQAYFERPEDLKNLYDEVENILRNISKNMPKVRDEREEQEKRERDSLLKTVKTPGVLKGY